MTLILFFNVLNYRKLDNFETMERWQLHDLIFTQSVWGNV